MLLVDELGPRARQQEALLAVPELACILLVDGMGVAGGFTLGQHDAAITPLHARALGDVGAPDVGHGDLDWQTASHPEIQMIQGRGPYGDSHLTGPRLGRLNLGEGDDIRPSVLRKDCGSHNSSRGMRWKNTPGGKLTEGSGSVATGTLFRPEV